MAPAGTCVVVAGEFATIKASHTGQNSFVYEYDHNLQTFRNYGSFIPSVWSYHGYHDISYPDGQQPVGAAGPEGPMADTIDAIKTYRKAADWNTRSGPPQVWMSEGAVAEMDFGTATPESTTPGTLQGSTCSGGGTPS